MCEYRQAACFDQITEDDIFVNVHSVVYYDPNRDLYFRTDIIDNDIWTIIVPKNYLLKHNLHSIAPEFTPGLTYTRSSLVLGYDEKNNTWCCSFCGEDMGEGNPRQLCCKTYCHNEVIDTF